MFNSFEFVFQLSLWGALLLPLAFVWSRIQWPMIVAGGVLPFCILLIGYAIRPEGDLGFHLLLLSLSWLPTLFWCALCFFALKRERRLRYFYSLVGLSALISALFFVGTPSLTFMDPFFGVLPGTISLDPVIHLDLYWQRFWISLFIAALFLGALKFRRLAALPKLLTYWVLAVAASFVWPNSTTPKMRYEMAFKEFISQPPFKIYIQDPSTTAWASDEWMEEFQFQWKQLLKRLPPQAEFRSTPKISIFIYSSDEEKRRWMGAARTQVGNFVRDEMHLSGLEIDSPIIAHELVHMLHGFLKVPLTTYLDPFSFEGFAVALSENETERASMLGAALVQEIGPGFEWPKAFHFFSRYSGPVAYALAGAYANENLKRNEWPWTKPLSIESFRNSKVDQAFQKRAKIMLTRKSLLQDPLVRDCSRLLILFRQNPLFEKWQEFLSVCRNSPLAYESIFELPDRRELALLELSSRAHPNTFEIAGDRSVLDQNFNEAKAHYLQCADQERCRLKIRAIDEKSGLKLKALILTTSRQLLELYRLFALDTKELALMRPLLPMKERAEVLKEVQRKRALNPSELFELLKAEFYLKGDRFKILKASKGLSPSDKQWLENRLSID